MVYNFNEVIDRSQTSTYKYGRCKLYFGTDNVLPLWVADMDFASPDFVLESIQKRLEHPILGYTLTDDAFFSAIIQWMKIRHNWTVEKEWIRHLPGVVPGLILAMLSYTNPGDKVIVQPPIYPPFMYTVKRNKRQLIYNQLVEKNGRYEMDLEDFENHAKKGAKFFLMCSPHNPGGMVWSKETLTSIADIADKYGMIVVSDEIHADLLLKGSTHYAYSTISEKAKNHSITLVAPSKTFNIAGLGIASAIIPNDKLRQKFISTVDDLQAAGGNIVGFEAAKAAYTEGHEWLDQLLVYLENNANYVIDFLNKNIPKIKPMKPEASFLIWLDCKELGLSDDELKDFMVKKAGLGLNHGPSFGPGGSGFQRLNIGTPLPVLEEAMGRLLDAYKTL